MIKACGQPPVVVDSVSQAWANRAAVAVQVQDGAKDSRQNNMIIIYCEVAAKRGLKQVVGKPYCQLNLFSYFPASSGTTDRTRV